MHMYPLTRVAYIDNICINRSGDSIFYSVLVKSDGHGKIQEVYRVTGCLVTQYISLRLCSKYSTTGIENEFPNKCLE